MNLTPYIISAALTMGGAAQCERQDPAPTPEAPVPAAPSLPPCAGTSITIFHDESTNCDLISPQTLSLRIPLALDWQGICDDAGGRITFVDPIEQDATCYDVDY